MITQEGTEKKGAAMKSERESAVVWVFYSTAGDKEGIYDLS